MGFGVYGLRVGDLRVWVWVWGEVWGLGVLGGGLGVLGFVRFRVRAAGVVETGFGVLPA